MAHRWRGYGHPELYNMINSGPGPSASEPQIAYWKSLTEELSQVDADLNHKLSSMGATWEGKAAESAQTGLTPLAEWAADAESGSTVMRASSELQADYIADARANMPQPVKVTTPAPSGWQLASAAAGAITGNPGPAIAVAVQAADHEAQERAQDEAEQKAVATMESYETSSSWNRETLGTFVAPPDVVVATPPPQGGSGVAVESASSAAGANAQGSSQPTSSSSVAIPTGNGTAGTGGTLVPGGAGTAQPPATTVPTGAGVSVIPATTTPQSLLPTPTQPPLGQPPLQPGPITSTPPVGPSNPALNNNPLLPTVNPGLNGPNGGGNNNPQTAANRGPLVGRGPVPPSTVPGQPVPPVNAGEAARRGLPLRGGLPTGGGGAVQPDIVRQGNQYGRGGVGGAVPGANAAVRSGPGAAAAAGGRGATAGGVRGPGAAGGRGGVAGPMGAGGRRADGEDDEERYAPDYLLETEDVFGDDRRVVPGVIGDSAPQE